MNKQSGVHQFTEENKSERLSYQLSYRHQLDGNKMLSVKNSLTYFEREIIEPEFIFRGKQWSSFNEASYSFGTDKSSWITGLNLYTDRFNEVPFDSLSRDYNYVTIGAFGQNTFTISEKYVLESGLRFDLDKDYGFFALPRLSLLAKFNSSFSASIGGGLGYKLPTILTEEGENLTYQGILPINSEVQEAEKSIGGNFDVKKNNFGK